jgi:hypothetical protein
MGKPEGSRLDGSPWHRWVSVGTVLKAVMNVQLL